MESKDLKILLSKFKNFVPFWHLSNFTGIFWFLNFRVLECFGVFISLQKFHYAASESSLESEPVWNYPSEEGRTAAPWKREEKGSLLKILIQSTLVTLARKKNPVDTGRALIKKSLLVTVKLLIVILSLLWE